MTVVGARLITVQELLVGQPPDLRRLGHERRFVPREVRQIAHQRGVRAERGDPVRYEQGGRCQLLKPVSDGPVVGRPIGSQRVEELLPGRQWNSLEPLVIRGLLEHLINQVGEKLGLNRRRQQSAKQPAAEFSEEAANAGAARVCVQHPVHACA